MKKKIFKIGFCLFGLLAVFCSVFLPISKNLYKVSDNQIAHADSVVTNYQVDTSNLFFNQFFSTSNTTGAWDDFSLARWGSLSVSFRIIVTPGSVSFWIKYSGIVSNSNNFNDMMFGETFTSGSENDPDYVDGFLRILTVTSAYSNYVKVPLDVRGIGTYYFWIRFEVPTLDLDVFQALNVTNQFGSNWCYNGFEFECSNGNSCSILIPSVYNSNNAASVAYRYWIYSPRTYYYSTVVSDNVSYSTGVDFGFSQGYADGDAVGYARGKADGETIGYNRGYNAGVNASNSYSFAGLISSVIDVPVQTFTSLFHFEILGVYLDGFFLGLFTLCIIVFVVKLFL